MADTNRIRELMPNGRAEGHYGGPEEYIGLFPSTLDRFEFLRDTQPLVDQGALVVLPRKCGIHHWNHPSARVMKCPRPYSDDRDDPAFATWSREQRATVEAVSQLTEEKSVSNTLGCIHICNTMTADPVGIPDLPNPNATTAAALMQLRIPSSLA